MDGMRKPRFPAGPLPCSRPEMPMKFHRAAPIRQAALIGLMPLVMAFSGCGGGSSSKPPAGPTPQAQPSAAGDAVPAPDAFRFLQQATMGAAPGDEARVKALGYEKWIDEQVGTAALDRYVDYVYRGGPRGCLPCAQADNDVQKAQTVQDAFWYQTLEGKNQLRLRTAFALSQLFVVSGANSTTLLQQERALPEFQTMLVENAFGNFRELLEKVALHPTMGVYLSHLQNDKGDDRADGTGRLPDENFAREVMQLFTIGKWKLNADGTRQLDASGQPMPTYTQADIMGMAKVFTGWSWGGPDTSDRRWNGWNIGAEDTRAWNVPMQPYEEHHAKLEKRIVGGVVIKANVSARDSLKIALDTLSEHPNTGPFVAQHFIKRLVTSNPSPAYVARVSAAFNQRNAKGQRGDLLAVVKAVLLDPEARDPAVNQASGGGKLREPVLRLSAALRALGATNAKHTYQLRPLQNWPEDLGQTPWMPPSVFNFFGPDHVPSSAELIRRRLSMPEAQIFDESTSVGYVNYLHKGLSQGFGSAAFPITLDTAALEALAADPAALVSELALRLNGGPVSTGTRDLIVQGVNGVASSASPDWKARRVQVATLMFLSSPDFLIQK